MERHVTTFQHHDVAMSRRLVNSSKNQRATQRRDVLSSRSYRDSCFKFIKSTRPNFWDNRRMYGRGGENEAGATREIEKTRVFVFLFSKSLMIYRTMLVLNSDMF